MFAHNKEDLLPYVSADTGKKIGGVFFQRRCPFLHRERKSWPILDNLGYFVANICTFLGLNNAVVTQNLQISGMHDRYIC